MGRLIDRRGDPRYGVFDEPVAEVNYRDFDLRSPLGGRRGALARHFRFHQFQFLGGLSESLVLGCALIDLRVAAQAFLYFYEPLSRRLVERRFRVPFGTGTHFDQRPEDGSASLRSGDNYLAMTANGEPRQRQLWVRLADGTEVDAVFDEEEPRLQPMWICTPAGATGFVYVRKTAGARVRGTLRREGTTTDLAELDMLGHNDWSAGYMRRETFWNWGCLAGRLADGRVVGLNVSNGVNETGHTENCFWVDGRLHRLGPVAFDYDRRDLMKTWTLADGDDRLELEFTPEGFHGDRSSFGLLASNFRQLFGRYRGTLVTTAGERVGVQGQLGFAERNYVKW